MSDTSYQDWCQRHATVFSLRGEGDAEMMLSWCMTFSAAGYTPDELMEVTHYLATTPGKVPQNRPQHLEQISARMRELKIQQFRANQDAQPVEGYEGHGLCGGTGMAWVPHPRLIIDGSWVFPHYEASVLCDCPKGQWLRQAHEPRKKRLLTIEAYEARYPNWKQLVSIRTAHYKEMAKAKVLTEKAEKDWRERRMRLKEADFGDAFEGN